MLDAEALADLVADLVADEVDKATAPLVKRIAELEARKPEPGPPGEKGEAGEPGEKGMDGKDGLDGTDGKDGRGVKDLLIDREGSLVATMDDGEMKNLGPVVGKDGDKGEDGRDGFSLEDFDACVLEDDRTIQLSFKSADHEHIATMKWPTMIYRGVFKDGTDYEQGDVVTWGGSLWHCDSPTKEKPGTDSWTLAAKKGRDGKSKE